MYIALNDQILPADQAAISCHDRGLLLADGVFETFKIEDQQALYLEQHLERLFKGAELLNIPHAISVQKIAKAIEQLIAINQLSEKTLSARLTLTRGVGPRGLLPPEDSMPTVILSLSPYPEPSAQPMKLWVSPNRRNEFSALSSIKSLSYTENVLGKMEAVKRGADDALFLNTKGFVACTSCANIFIEKNNRWMTPPLSDGALPGITRARILASGRTCEERSITLEECDEADAIFVTNALMGIKPAFLA
jgi:branched-chain amino acid aminotransferase